MYNDSSIVAGIRQVALPGMSRGRGIINGLIAQTAPVRKVHSPYTWDRASAGSAGLHLSSALWMETGQREEGARKERGRRYKAGSIARKAAPGSISPW